MLGPDVHIGTDEYNKKEAEQYRYFMSAAKAGSSSASPGIS